LLRGRSPNLIGTDGKIKANYKQFFHTLKYYIELENDILVHAGFNFKQDAPYSEHVAMLELRTFNYNFQKAKNKHIIHGHNPEELENIQKAIQYKAPIIPLDNGCVYTKKHRYYDYTKLGNLCAFNLDSRELILQKNGE